MRISTRWLRDFVELGVDDLRLAEGLTSIGIAVESISGEGVGAVFEMEIGTNRPDAMNHYGVAREAAALYGVALKPLPPATPQGVSHPPAGSPPSAAKTAAARGAGGGVTVEILEPEGCARYTAQVLRGVRIKASPEEIQSRLTLVEQRPINNAADASNYTLWEMGHPTHAFDLDLLEGGKIVVRRARKGETLKTLDGVERELFVEDLVIADQTKPVALAGVIGGFDTMITERTRNVLIESAWFDPATVRQAAKRHLLHTDASHRFERGADFRSTALACRLVAERIRESGGGTLEGEAIDCVARELLEAPVRLRVPEVERILGSKLAVEEIVSILTRLGFELTPEQGSLPEFPVRIPSWRLDVEREIDVIEEIARLHGYDRFPPTLPPFSGAVVDEPESAKKDRLRSRLLALGYNETISLSFIAHEDAQTFSSASAVELANPISEEAAFLRSSLLPGMLNMLAYNLNRGTERVRLFEIGGIYQAAGEEVVEQGRISLGVTVSALEQDMARGGALEKNQARSDLDTFRSLKGDLEHLLSAFEWRSLAFDREVPDYLRPGRSARAILDGETVAQFGELLPEIAAQRKLRQPVLIAELLTHRLYRRPLREIRYEPLPKFPAVERDFSFLFADEVTWERIEGAVRALGWAEIRDFSPIEIFRGGSIPSGRYSILMRLKFQSRERTLREAEVADWSQKIVSTLEALGGTQRA